MLGKLVGFLLVGLVAGWIVGYLQRGKGFGFVGNLMVGVVGAVTGGLLFPLFGLHATSLVGAIVMAVAGAFVFLFIARALRR